MIKVGDRIVFKPAGLSLTNAKGVVVDSTDHVPQPILLKPINMTMYQVKWDIHYRGVGYLTWEESSNLQLDLQTTRDIKLEKLGINTK